MRVRQQEMDDEEDQVRAGSGTVAVGRGPGKRDVQLGRGSGDFYGPIWTNRYPIAVLLIPVAKNVISGPIVYK